MRLEYGTNHDLLKSAAWLLVGRGATCLIIYNAELKCAPDGAVIHKKVFSLHKKLKGLRTDIC